MKHLLLILCLSVATWFGVQAQPVMEFVQKGYNLGQISESGGVVSRVYKFRNSGDAPLVILRAETACACTKASFSKNQFCRVSRERLPLSTIPVTNPEHLIKQLASIQTFRVSVMS